MIIIVVLFLCVIGILENGKVKPYKDVENIPLLDYEYIGCNYVLPVIQKAARSEAWDVSYPNTGYDISCVENVKLCRNQLVYTITMVPRGTVTNHELEIHFRNELVTAFARTLQVDYRIIRSNLHIRIVDVPGLLKKNLWLEFSDELILAIKNAQISSYL